MDHAVKLIKNMKTDRLQMILKKWALINFWKKIAILIYTLILMNNVSK